MMGLCWLPSVILTGNKPESKVRGDKLFRSFGVSYIAFNNISLDRTLLHGYTNHKKAETGSGCLALCSEQRGEHIINLFVVF